jgi:D-alanyl-D-alanine carboxypeptidase
MRFVAAGMVLAAAAAIVSPASANPKYSGFVIDANTGKVLYSSNADEQRYPASLTKMMTLYLTFERLAAGQISRSTPVPVSAKASAEAPSKLGLKAGQTITVENAILALVTKSANDVATALGEFMGGSEQNFARMMTAKARSLGMNSTTFRNAHGLPNPGQVTTARDMATLGIALREHFPQFYSYFSTRSFTYGRSRIGNHNRLLGRLEGVDGIKTGYINAAGFNLVTSIKSDGKSVVGVVLGGRTASSRDNQMAELLRTYLPKASRRDTGPLIARRGTIEAAPPVVASVTLPGRGEAPIPGERPAMDVASAYVETQKQTMPQMASAAPATIVEEQGDIDPVNTSSTGLSGWAIQVGSMPTGEEARDMLDKAGRIAASAIGGASPFTELFALDGRTYHRARFGGFASKTSANGACNVLRKAGMPCYALPL